MTLRAYNWRLIYQAGLPLTNMMASSNVNKGTKGDADKGHHMVTKQKSKNMPTINTSLTG